MVYYISLFSKIRSSLTYLPTQKSVVICECSLTCTSARKFKTPKLSFAVKTIEINDFCMAHVEIWFLFISANNNFTNFLKMYGNFSMTITYTNSYRNIDLGVLKNLWKGTSINDVPRFLAFFFFFLPTYVPFGPFWKKLPI